MSNTPVAWSIASSNVVEFTSTQPAEAGGFMFSSWSLDDLISLLNTTLGDVFDYNDAALKAKFEERTLLCSGKLPEGDVYAIALESFKQGFLINSHEMLYAQQRMKLLEAALAKKISPEHWQRIEAHCWKIFEDGKYDYRGSTKERLEELRTLLSTGEPVA